MEKLDSEQMKKVGDVATKLLKAAIIGIITASADLLKDAVKTRFKI